MELPLATLTRADFEASGWTEALADADESVLGGAFRSRADTLRESGSDGPARALYLLADVVTYSLTSNSEDERLTEKNGPFVPLWTNYEEGRRSALPEDLSDTDLDRLAEVLAELPQGTADPLAARLGDVLWLRRRDHRAAQRAAVAYLDAADAREREGDALASPALYRRGVDLTAQVGGKRGGLLRQALDRIWAAAVARPEGPTRAHANDLLDLLLDRKYADPARIAALAVERAEEFESANDLHAAKGFWKRAARAHEAAGDAQAAHSARARVAECLVGLANEAPMAMNEASYLESAIQTYRAVPGSKERREELHARLLRVQGAVTGVSGEGGGELGVISHRMELGDWPPRARASVADQDLQGALFTLGIEWVQPMDPDELREHVIAGARETPLLMFIPKIVMNEGGRTVARAPGALDDEEGAIRARMQEDASFGRKYTVAGIIRPARQQIEEEHAPTEEDLMDLTARNAFVPPGRARTFARALAAGFAGDFVLASHLLVSQVEHALRVALVRSAGVRINPEEEATQPRFGLGQMLYEPWAPVLASIFGVDTVFELRSLLVDPLGANLRNRIVHGLLADGAARRDAEYLWALVLRLCCQHYQGPPPDGFERGRPPSPDESAGAPEPSESSASPGG